MKYFKAKNDAMFKTIFCDDNNRSLLKQLIEEVIEEEVEILSINAPELKKDNVRAKGRTLDVLVKTKKGEINIELNSNSSEELHYRNASYIFKRYVDAVNVGDSYRMMENFIQINLTSGNEKIPLKSLYTLYDNENKASYVNNLKIYEINLKKAKESWYNIGGKVTLIGLLDCDKEELEKAKGDELVEKLKGEIERLNEDKEFIGFLSEEDENRLFINTFIEKGFEQGIEQGIEKGKEQGTEEATINIAKNMLKETDDLEFISRITGLSTEEIEKLK